MTLTTLLIYVAIAALILTLAVAYILKKAKSLPMSYAQNFVGALFVFSGWVKAVDPLGTAYKMEQYFAEFEATFQGTWFNFLSPLFPFLTDYAIAFSVFMIVFEIVLGAMLLLGHKPKFTAWAFLILVGFFTFLTGFTYLTGYVPSDANFFDLAAWSSYKESNMKVTDCGCFGDFIKLKPKISFFKDVFLLIPAVYFIVRRKDMHELWGHTARNIALSLLTLGLLFYSFSNYVWDIPHKDFRPFKKGLDLAGQKQAEEEAMGNVQITAYNLTNKATGETVSFTMAEYLKNFQDYPSKDWNIETESSEPSIPITKISEFEIMDFDGNTVNDWVFNSDRPLVLIVAHKLYGDGVPGTRVVKDTIYRVDTIRTSVAPGFRLEENVLAINERTESFINFLWKDYYTKRYTEVVLPFIRDAQQDGLEVVAVVGGADENQIADFKEDLGMNVRFAVADDILLKTIVRSNPGILLLKDGVILDKWHYRKLPPYIVVKEEYLQE